jgi:hypothetical protein
MTSRPEPPRVVAAVSPELRERIRSVLPDCELRFVDTGAQLARALDAARCDMLLIGLHFDESTAAGAVERVLAREETFPVVCVHGRTGSLLGERTLEASRVALRALGAHNFIDLLDYPDDALGNARVQAMLERLLPQEAPP